MDTTPRCTGLKVHIENEEEHLSAIVCCSLMPTLNSTGNTRRGLPSLISSGKVWKTSCGNGTSTVKWSLNGRRERNYYKRKKEEIKYHLQCSRI